MSPARFYPLRFMSVTFIIFNDGTFAHFHFYKTEKIQIF